MCRLAPHALVVLLTAAGLSSVAAQGAGSTDGPRGGIDLPVQVPLTVDLDESDRFDLSRIGSCCSHVREFSTKPPALVNPVPPEVGTQRLFTAIELADSTIVLAFEDVDENREAGGSLLVRADLDQDGDLTDDPVRWCRRGASCGPFETEIRAGGVRYPYAFTVRFFTLPSGSREINVLWHWRALALTGTFAGREIAVIDDDTNGRYDDPEDVVVVDLDGDGTLDGGHDGRERLRRHTPFVLDGESLVVARIDPAAPSLRVDRTPLETETYRAIDVQTGKKLPGVRVTSYPGGYSATTDDRGRARIERPAGEADYVTAVADGYWSAVLGPGQRAGEGGERFLLERGPCRQEGVRWCGRESLGASSNWNSHIDLDSGVVGPRVGETPGPKDVGWYIPPGGFYLKAFEGAGLSVLGSVHFESVTLDRLRALPFDQERVYGSKGCGSGETDGPLGTGVVLGVRTQEGRLGKILIDGCDYTLGLSWVLYDEQVAREPSESPPP